MDTNPTLLVHYIP